MYIRTVFNMNIISTFSEILIAVSSTAESQSVIVPTPSSVSVSRVGVIYSSSGKRSRRCVSYISISI